MGEDDLTDIYRQESAESLESEAAKRIAEVADPVRDARLRATALKDLLESDDLVRSGQWKGWSPTLMRGMELRGATMGIVGMGRIGAAVAERARLRAPAREVEQAAD